MLMTQNNTDSTIFVSLSIYVYPYTHTYKQEKKRKSLNGETESFIYVNRTGNWLGLCRRQFDKTAVKF